MHMLHDYVAKQLADRIKSRHVVVWYDERGEFQPFVDEVRGGPRTVSEPVPAVVASAKASFVEYAGSMFELRAVVESHVSGDTPAPIVVYIPGVARDRHASVLMELEKAGTTWEPQLKQLAKNVLLQKYTLGVVDEILRAGCTVTWSELARAAAGTGGAEPPSKLKSIFHDASGNDGLLTAWLVSDARDSEIMSKDATPELTKLVKARLGLDLAADASLAKLRATTLRYVLAGEFRLDLGCEAPDSLDSVVKAATKDGESAVRDIARCLRATHANAYEEIADRLERELQLKEADVPPQALGSIDTFRFEERALLEHAGELVALCKFEEALRLVSERERSFWVDRHVARKAQWEATRHMAVLGSLATEVRASMAKAPGTAAAWLEAYTAPTERGWFRLDQAQRRLEAWVANLKEEPQERPLAVVRRMYDDVVHEMARGFTQALGAAGWSMPGALHQTGIWSESVATRPRPVAYFLVDAMRYEMGVELSERLPKSTDVAVRAAVSALPSITPVGMAALMPGASASFSVVEQAGVFGARIDDSFLPDLAARKKFAASRVPKLVDLSLDDLLVLPPSKLKKKVEGAQVVVVRSQEIDHAGETGWQHQARQVMDTVIDNLSRAIRKLSGAGIEHAVVTADHGHLFSGDRDESMRIDAPGGATVDLHRRCWIGRGGKTPPGCVRVAAATLGYDSDLEFVFPSGSGVFKAGGDLGFHHGGPTLQECIVPVVSIRTPTREESSAATGLEFRNVPEAITNGIFTVAVTLARSSLPFSKEALEFRLLLVGKGKPVGDVGMVVGAAHDATRGVVTFEPGREANVAFVLRDREVENIRIIAQDPATDAEVYRSPKDIPCDLEF